MTRQTVILGGGISGLSLAFYLKLLRPAHHVTVLEKQPRWGGWIRTEKLDGSLFELGPHSLRSSGADAKNVLELCYMLGLQSSILFCDSKFAGRRFVYNQDRIEKVPGTLYETLFDSSSTSKALRQGLKQFLKTLGTHSWPNVEDLSIESYGLHVFGKSFTDSLLDPLVGGIYGGNVTSLSMRSCFPSLFQNQSGEGDLLSVRQWIRSSLMQGMNSSEQQQPLIANQADQKKFQDLVSIVRHKRVWTLREGLQSLTDSLVHHLSSLPNVTLKTNCPVLQLDIKKDDTRSSWNSVSISTRDEVYDRADHVISTIHPVDFASLLSEEEQQQPLKTLLNQFPPASDVGLVSLSYSREDVESLLREDNPCRGFGYLVSSKDTKSNGLLGVLFDSFVFPQQDHPTTKEFRISVMLRGSRLLENHPNLYQSDCHELLEKIALDYLRSHMGMTQTPLKSKVTYHRQCIPQYQVFHHKKLGELDELMKRSKLSEKLWFCSGALGDGIGVPKCISRSRHLAEKLITMDIS